MRGENALIYSRVREKSAASDARCGRALLLTVKNLYGAFVIAPVLSSAARSALDVFVDTRKVSLTTPATRERTQTRHTSSTIYGRV
jgi:hypothetical protein